MDILLPVCLEPWKLDGETVIARDQTQENKGPGFVRDKLANLLSQVVGQSHRGATDDCVLRIGYAAGNLSVDVLRVTCRREGQEHHKQKCNPTYRHFANPPATLNARWVRSRHLGVAACCVDMTVLSV